jgi:transcription termination factor NusB
MLESKKTLWKRHLHDLGSLARQKLVDYYDRTEETGSTIYNLACILDPAQKLQTYQKLLTASICSTNEKEYRNHYNAHYAHFNSVSTLALVKKSILQFSLATLVAFDSDTSNTSLFQAAALNNYLPCPTTKDSDSLFFWRTS